MNLMHLNWVDVVVCSRERDEFPVSGGIRSLLFGLPWFLARFIGCFFLVRFDVFLHRLLILLMASDRVRSSTRETFDLGLFSSQPQESNAVSRKLTKSVRFPCSHALFELLNAAGTQIQT